jgi:hypothetical protein
MTTEFAARLEQPGYIADWARKVVYNCELSAEDHEMNNVADAFWKEIGRTGHDAKHEISALLTKALTPDVVTAPGELLSRMFVEGSIGEFDYRYVESMPKNTLKAYESIVGGNVDASYIDHSALTPTHVELQIETYLPLQELRRGGYKTVATYVNFAREAFEQKKVSAVMTAVSAAITNGAANYINEATTSPTDASMLALTLYLHDMNDGGTPFVFGLNKYIQAISILDKADKNKTDVEKSMWFNQGFLAKYNGVDLIGFSGQKLLADGSNIVPNNTLIGVAGKIGTLDMKGDIRVMQDTDINKEHIHLKMTGYGFDYVIADITKAAKMVIA